MQYTINRGTLKTNRIISKFKVEVSELCSFCNTEIETISHLFHSCNLVQEFLRNVYSILSQKLAKLYSILTKIFLFTNVYQRIDSPQNFIHLYIKRFIWICRCTGRNLEEESFVRWFKLEIEVCKMAAHKLKNLEFLLSPEYQNIFTN